MTGPTSTERLPLAAEGESTIEIGHHVEWEIPGLGWTVNLDTVWSTLIAAGLVLLLGFFVRRALTRETHVPSKIQLLWEGVVGEVNRQVEGNLGKVHPFVAPLAIALFFFILLANWLEAIPTNYNEDTGHLLPPPTADTNLTYALAALVIVSVWVYGIRQRGVKGYFSHFVGMSIFPEKKLVDVPVRGVFTFLNVLEELIKPVTLALRLFGNIFAGGIMLSLIALMPLYALWAPNLVWKAFELFIGAIQAFIFALLTVLYFAMAGAGHDEHDEEHEAEPDETADTDSGDESVDQAPDRGEPALAR